ncbi:MAG: hypothetical protein ACXVAE_00605 [Candidatus Limnocylindrales bacterium]
MAAILTHQRRGWLRASSAAIAAAMTIAACSAAGASPSGLPFPSEIVPSPSVIAFASAPPPVAPHAGIAGRVLAGPTCPVERIPPDPACAPRGLIGAIIVITDAHGVEVARVTSTADATYAANLPPGDYILKPQPFSGLMGTARAQAVEVVDGLPGPTVDLTYDTGIR